ncbi:hypothetical protein Tco_0856362 [Tanacetum coccineum]|uniref:Uncharacterized protein n=1 Tax=Tanacetum coccineum TaxID=301880 RepID=A0ABQ5B397_9ASTR
MPKRMTRLEEEVHGLRESLGDQRAVLDAMNRDFYRLTTWTVGRLSQLLDASGMTYTSYSDYQIPYQRRTRRRIDGANTFAKRNTFWSLNQEISRYCSDNLYVVSIKEDTAYLCLHFTKNYEELKSNTPYPEDSIRCIEDYLKILEDIERGPYSKKPPIRREGVSLEEGGEYCGFDSIEEEVVPKVDDVSLVGGVFEGAFGGDGDEDFVVGEGMVVLSSSLVRPTKSCLGEMMVSLIFLERLEDEA